MDDSTKIAPLDGYKKSCLHTFLWPKISIITPCYNSGLFLEETILSVLNQNYSNLEYIIIDGGSTDNTIEIIRKYESYLAYYESTPDRGQSHAINKGLARASGQIFNWLNADDILFPNALFHVAKAFLVHPSAGFIYGSGKKVGFDATEVLKSVVAQAPNLNRLSSIFYFLQPSCFLNLQAVKDVGGINESLQYAMDWDLCLRIAKKYPFYAIQDDISMLRMYETTKTSQGGYERSKEIAMVGKRHNGVADINFILFTFFWIFFFMNSKKCNNSIINKLNGLLRSLLHKISIRYPHMMYF